MKQHLTTIATLLFAVQPLQAQVSQEDFRKPPLQERPSALWSWLNGHVDHAQNTRELEEMRAMSGTAKPAIGVILKALVATAEPLWPICWEDLVQIAHGQLAAAVFFGTLREELKFTF
jgi:hypothetical protein